VQDEARWEHIGSLDPRMKWCTDGFKFVNVKFGKKILNIFGL